MMDALSNAFTWTQAWIFEHAVQPVLLLTDTIAYQEDAFDATEWFLLGALQVAILYAVLRPMEALWPAERWINRKSVRVDVLYTLLHRLGVFPLLVFFVLTPLSFQLAEATRELGFTPFNLDDLWPGVTDVGWVSFALYLIVLDFINYWMHRGQHRLRWWWALHALHHSQRQMSFWADNRNHLLDDLIRDAVLAVAALVIGVEPGQFVGLVIIGRMIESLQHANIRFSFGPLERVLVSPIFHRRHHAIGYGHEGRARGCNFAVLFPVWDLLFRTAEFHKEIQPTGVRDQLAPPAGTARDYGEGFWAQQWLGLKRMLNFPASDAT